MVSCVLAVIAALSAHTLKRRPLGESSSRDWLGAASSQHGTVVNQSRQPSSPAMTLSRSRADRWLRRCCSGRAAASRVSIHLSFLVSEGRNDLGVRTPCLDLSASRGLHRRRLWRGIMPLGALRNAECRVQPHAAEGPDSWPPGSLPSSELEFKSGCWSQPSNGPICAAAQQKTSSPRSGWLATTPPALPSLALAATSLASDAIADRFDQWTAAKTFTPATATVGPIASSCACPIRIPCPPLSAHANCARNSALCGLSPTTLYGDLSLWLATMGDWLSMKAMGRKRRCATFCGLWEVDGDVAMMARRASHDSRLHS
jgi:hypothetical protein